jgi:Mrp family chromosome partitioning ATPase
LEKSETVSLEELNNRARAFPAAVIDLGAVRLDPRALPLVRPNDPVLLVVCSGYTERSDLLATINLFSNIGRPVRGIVLNPTESAIPQWIRRLLGKNKER